MVLLVTASSVGYRRKECYYISEAASLWALGRRQHIWLWLLNQGLAGAKTEGVSNEDIQSFGETEYAVSSFVKSKQAAPQPLEIQCKCKTKSGLLVQSSSFLLCPLIPLSLYSNLSCLG